MKMRSVNRLEQWTLYPMIFLWVAAFIVGFYDSYLYLEIIYNATERSTHKGKHAY